MRRWRVKAGVAPRRDRGAAAGRAAAAACRADEEAALDFARELLHTHGVSEPTYAAALARFGEQGVVELDDAGRLLRDGVLADERRPHAGQPGAQAGIDAFPP